jgi:predicted metalloprotease with PDZ domain
MPRYCKLKRSSKSEFYGFDLKTYKKDIKHMIINIINDTPAHTAGLIEGDVILEVNGESVESADRDTVVAKIIKHPKHVELLVVNDYKIYLENKDPALNSSTNNNNIHHYVKHAGTLPILNNRSNRTSTISSTQNIGKKNNHNKKKYHHFS